MASDLTFIHRLFFIEINDFSNIQYVFRLSKKLGSSRIFEKENHLNHNQIIHFDEKIVFDKFEAIDIFLVLERCALLKRTARANVDLKIYHRTIFDSQNKNNQSCHKIDLKIFRGPATRQHPHFFSFSLSLNKFHSQSVCVCPYKGYYFFVFVEYASDFFIYINMFYREIL